jgi:hypothetical protein
MKKLVRNLLFFILPVLIIISLIQVNKRSNYLGLKDDCANHGIWIYDRITSNNKKIDIAFIGSSHTINGINDKLISERLKTKEAVNFGYCRFGRNLSYVLLKEIYERKKIKQLVLEVTENEDQYSHPVFPFLASTKDVLFPNLFFNRDIITDIWSHFAFKIEIFQDKFYSDELKTPLNTRDFGKLNSTDTASVNLLDATKNTVNKKSKFEQDFRANFARVYLRKISDFCKENKIQLTFLYIPSYVERTAKPIENQTYIKYGKVLIPPRRILNKQANWYDENHLNQSGADELSVWVSNQLVKK